MFIYHKDSEIKDLGGGFTRRVLAWNEQLMAAEMTFETGTEGKLHTHPHTQCSYVISGCFRYTVNDETAELGPGDSVVVPSGAVHGTLCVEGPGVLLDIFTPMREDFLG